MGLTELTLILFVALVLFGPEDLPVIARTLGKIVYQVRRYTTEISKEFQEALNTPGNVINEALKDKPDKKDTASSDPSEETEELLSYDDSKDEGKSPQSTNPLAELPSDMISYSKEPQAGE